MSKVKKLAVVMLASAVSLPLVAQTCKTETIAPSFEPDQLIDNRDGTVTDAKTGLMWSKCSLGQEWTGAECLGDPINYSSWEAALKAGETFNDDGGLAGKEDWRLPNIKELGSLVERQCYKPAINEDYFPGIATGNYLSATVKVDQSGNVQGGRGIKFENGFDVSGTSKEWYVRLVRSN